MKTTERENRFPEDRDDIASLAAEATNDATSALSLKPESAAPDEVEWARDGFPEPTAAHRPPQTK